MALESQQYFDLMIHIMKETIKPGKSSLFSCTPTCLKICWGIFRQVGVHENRRLYRAYLPFFVCLKICWGSLFFSFFLLIFDALISCLISAFFVNPNIFLDKLGSTKTSTFCLSCRR